MSVQKLIGYLQVTDRNPMLVQAQVAALRTQVPLLYVILGINSGALAFTHYGIAPDWLVLGPLGALCLLCGVRFFAWRRVDPAMLLPKAAFSLLSTTNRLAGILAVSYLSWSLCLASYGDEATHSHVLFYVAITTIACVFCLMHLRSAAILVAVGVALPFTGYIFLQGHPVSTAIAINYLLVVGVMVFILFVYYRDFVRLIEQNDALKGLSDDNLRLASVDMLTGLPNRRSFFPVLDAAIETAANSHAWFAIGIIDLDGFKAVNDTYGHVAGDLLLREVGQRLQAVDCGESFLARLGGDEFGLILTDNPSATDLQALSHRIISALQAPFLLGTSTARIGASIGFALFPDAGRSAAQLVERADYALYHAKDHQRGTGVLFSTEHEARLRRHAAIEQALRQARFEDEFTLAFQPMVDGFTHCTTAFEALARWTSPTLGCVSPDQFIPVAERTGLINRLTEVLLVKALRAAASWPTSISLSFNLSMADLCSPPAVERLCELIVGSGIDPMRIQLEATETAIIQDFDLAQASLRRLKALGVSISLDDFGTGYSSLSYVHRLPVDKLKIDRSFTQDILDQASSRDIVRSIIDLSLNLKLGCVVEGVETAEQAVLLATLGCTSMQGYFFHKPMPEEDVITYLRHAGRPGYIGACSVTRYV
jgi:diguanylate cyclase (GGDEF)-like protein